MNLYRPIRTIAIGMLFTLIYACGGGGGGGSSSSNNNPPADNSTAPQNYVSQNIASNAISFGIQKIPGGGNVNAPYVSVDVCQPGTSICQTINNILLDTGSTGLRIFSSNLETLQLPSQTQNNSPIIECASFISGVTWGPVKLADIKLSAEIARSIPIQVVADPLYSSVPAYCSNGLPAIQTASSLGANGILGLGLYVADNQQYFTCSSNQTANCTSITLQANSQVQNPVASFQVNNNGVVLQTDQVSSLGAASASGTLYFGIDTQANNSSTGTNVIPTNSFGLFTTIFNGTTYTRSFIDSGSNGLYFPAGNLSATLKPCTSNISFYCPATTQSYSATINLKNNQTSNVTFSIANAESLGSSNNYAQPALGGTLQGLFDWGLPFFYGKNVYIGITGKSSNAGTGPLYAYKFN